jgi:hypothetical protein
LGCGFESHAPHPNWSPYPAADVLEYSSALPDGLDRITLCRPTLGGILVPSVAPICNEIIRGNRGPNPWATWPRIRRCGSLGKGVAGEAEGGVPGGP